MRGWSRPKFGRVPAAQVLNTGLFDAERASMHPLWAKELYGFADHVPETEEYGVSSFVYRARRPFDPARLHRVLNGDLPGVIRAKGHFWLATRPDWAGEFSLAGALSQVRPLGRWWAAVPKWRWPGDKDLLSDIAANSEAPWGDRRQELVFIGAGMDEAALRRALDAALVPATDFRPKDWGPAGRSVPGLGLRPEPETWA